MSFRFWKRIKLFPGLTLNLSKSGFSFSIGRRGFHYTVGSRGHRITAGVPGTGLFVTQKLSASHRHPSSGQIRPHSIPASLHPSFLKQLFLPREDLKFLEGCRAILNQDTETAYKSFSKCVSISARAADCAALAGYTALATGRFEDAVNFFERISRHHRYLGRLFEKYELSLTLLLPITEEIEVRVTPDSTGVVLGQAEALQHLGKHDTAISILKEYLNQNPDDPAIRLSLAELMMDAHKNDPVVCREVIRLTGPVRNENIIDAALMLYKAQALMCLGDAETAKLVLTTALRRRKGRPEILLHELRYLRAQAYEKIGRHADARKDLNRIFAENPDFRDVAEKLGLS